MTPEQKIEQAAHEHFKRGQLGFEKAADTEHAFIKGAKSEAAKEYWFEQFKLK